MYSLHAGRNSLPIGRGKFLKYIRFFFFFLLSEAQLRCIQGNSTMVESRPGSAGSDPGVGYIVELMHVWACTKFRKSISPINSKFDNLPV